MSISVITSFNLSPAKWRQHGRGLDVVAGGGLLVRAAAGVGIVTDFPVSRKADPAAGPDWNGYLVNEISDNLLTALSPKPNNVAWNNAHPMPLLPPALSLSVKQTLVYEFGFDVTDGALLNYQSDPGNTDKTTPPGFRPFIDGGSLTSNRWWSRQRWPLVKTGFSRLEVSLDPANWFDVNGIGADAGIAGQPQQGYLDALFRPTYIGLTFGGGFFAGHGVNVTNGNAAFTLFAFYTGLAEGVFTWKSLLKTALSKFSKTR